MKLKFFVESLRLRRIVFWKKVLLLLMMMFFLSRYGLRELIVVFVFVFVFIINRMRRGVFRDSINFFIV